MPKRVLLDENLPHKLRFWLEPHHITTVAYLGWAGISNGALVTAAEEAGFHVLLTADQGLNYQQSLKDHRLSIVVLSTNRSAVVLKNSARIVLAIDAVQPGCFLFVSLSDQDPDPDCESPAQ